MHETYGSAEGLMMGEQKDLDYMYIMSPNVFVELLDDEGNEVPNGQMGNVIVTNLNAFAMPLIRYKIGDLAIKLPKEYYPLNKDLAFPLWQKVVGRDTDLVTTPSGKYMVVHSFTGIFEHIPQIRQFCVIQESPNGILVKYIKGEGFKQDILKTIEQKILSNLNEAFIIQFHEVDHIPATKSGKPQLIISKLKKG